ncbi:MAG: hypothetical protein LBJ61_01085 [Deltaproteobacteria bacterium]|jgi:hypothetical protein|nr:hypothetical protein [Deltaproteobacteria bacterium]
MKTTIAHRRAKSHFSSSPGRSLKSVERAMTNHDEVAKLQKEIELLKKEISELKLKIPSGVLQVCSSCKKIKDPHGHWLALDRFLTLYAGLETSHGYCEECAARLIAEAES